MAYERLMKEQVEARIAQSEGVDVDTEMKELKEQLGSQLSNIDGAREKQIAEMDAIRHQLLRRINMLTTEAEALREMAEIKQRTVESIREFLGMDGSKSVPR